MFEHGYGRCGTGGKPLVNSIGQNTTHDIPVEPDMFFFSRVAELVDATDKIGCLW